VSDLGKILVGIGLVMLIVGGILLVGANVSSRLPWIGRLPGDIYIERDGWRFYFPLSTSILISLLLTLFLWMLSRR
jgi:hypothetical protein